MLMYHYVWQWLSGSDNKSVIQLRVMVQATVIGIQAPAQPTGNGAEYVSTLHIRTYGSHTPHISTVNILTFANGMYVCWLQYTCAVCQCTCCITVRNPYVPVYVCFVAILKLSFVRHNTQVLRDSTLMRCDSTQVVRECYVKNTLVLQSKTRVFCGSTVNMTRVLCGNTRVLCAVYEWRELPIVRAPHIPW